MFDTRAHYRSFILLLVIVSLGFLYILKPLYGAVLWGLILSILFYPLHKRFMRLFKGHRNIASLCTLLFCITVVILPLVWIANTLVQEVAMLYSRLQESHINLNHELPKLLASLPASVRHTLRYYDLADLNSIQGHLLDLLNNGSKEIANRVLSIGQNTFSVIINVAVMLYLLFFLLRDGDKLSGTVQRAIPLSNYHKLELLEKFTTVVRATVKGNIVVAIVQGILGGVIFAFLGVPGVVFWAVLMACLSLVPAVGSGLVWFPVAIYFIFTGDWAKGIILISYGVLVIGLVDNILRPLLVGKDTKLPDYVVLISTFGGLSLFGISGFILGPLIAALFVATWELYSDTQMQTLTHETKTPSNT